MGHGGGGRHDCSTRWKDAGVQRLHCHLGVRLYKPAAVEEQCRRGWGRDKGDGTDGTEGCNVVRWTLLEGRPRGG